MAAIKLFQRTWRSASAIDATRMFTSASRFAPACQNALPLGHDQPNSVQSISPVARLQITASSSYNLIHTHQPHHLRHLLTTVSHGGPPSSAIVRRSFTTNASPLHNQADPKRDDHASKPNVDDPYVMNLTVRDSNNVIKLGTSDRQQSCSEQGDKVEKLGLFQRLKQLYTNYWYISFPVHGITSLGWAVTFYYMSKRFVSRVRLSCAIVRCCV